MRPENLIRDQRGAPCEVVCLDGKSHKYPQFCRSLFFISVLLLAQRISLEL